WARQAARLPEIRRPRRQEEGDDVAEPVLDGAEAGAVAPALADVERRLAVVALRRIDGAQIGHVIEPALLGAGADVEVDALDRLLDADRILAAFEDVRDALGRLAALPALARLLGLAPAVFRAGTGGAARGLAPLEDALLEERSLGEVDDRVIVPGLATVSIG